MNQPVAVVIVLAAALVGCATRYQPAGTDITGGHLFRRHAENVFEVEFRGNGFTSPRRARDFALLRAAELCRDHNFRYFSIIGEGDNSQTEIIQMGGTSYTTGTFHNYGGGYGRFTGTTTTTTTNIPINKPRPSLAIRCFTGRPSGHAGPVLDSLQVINELRVKYKLNKVR